MRAPASILSLVTLALAAIAASSCTGTGGTTLEKDVPETPLDALADVLALDAPADSRLADRGWTDFAADPGQAESPFELQGGCAPGEGCFLEPCASGDDCQSGLCVEHMGDLVCSIACVEECPDGWLCKQASRGPDAGFLCVSPYSHLCRPCHTHADCQSASGVEDVCLAFGPEGSFCGANCAAGGVCPAGHSCKTATTIAGGVVQQCLPTSGLCACSQKSTELGLTTDCFLENDLGKCFGSRQCTDDGLTPCDAPVPSAEECNGEDDDCDGVTDDLDCEDGNPCTKDSCLAAAGCQHDPLSGTDCSDGNVCSLADHCENGACTGTSINCDDANLCTSDGCNATGGCIYTFNNAACDDGDPCTVDDACAGGACKGFKVPCECQSDLDCVPLEDGDVCNGKLFCDKTAFPQVCSVKPGTEIICPQPDGVGSECLAPSCHPLTGECSFVPDNEGKPCSDADPCTVSETCDKGACTGALPLNCNDGDPCTADACDPAQGCAHDPAAGPCDDGNPCTSGDLCVNGNCVPGKPVSCDDSSPCTDDWCEFPAGCQHKANSAACDDANACTIGDHCDAGKCLPALATDCDDDNPCTKDSCQPATGCAYVLLSAPCDDGNPCTLNDVCQAGKCKAGPKMDCNDNNPCTDDSCDAAGNCAHTANKNLCNDGNPCTTGDQCSLGLCVGSGAANCDDANACTTDWCDPAKGCQYTNNSAACNDGNACTVSDACKDGKCAGGPLVDCEDDNPCTEDLCMPASGCLHSPNSAPCDDENPCTTSDKCSAGFCKGTGGLDCDDLNQCTKDICVPPAGCKHDNASGPCDDGNPCTVNDACLAGQCQGGKPLSCDDGNPCTDDSCNQDGECVHSINAALCDDANACTTGDQCSLGKCTYKALLDCDDADVCTTDWCDPVKGCAHGFNTAPCNDQDFCTVTDACLNGKCTGSGSPNCNDGNVCTDDGCDPTQGCLHSANAAACNDGDACTPFDNCVGGVCVGSGSLHCEDGNVCTDDLCDKAKGCVYVNNAAPCNDGDACTTTDACVTGVCKGSGQLTCNDGNKCTSDTCDPLKGCLYPPVPVQCGNGCPEAGEGCDDGNLNNGDGCNASCQSECNNPGGGALSAENGTGQNKKYCYNPGDSTETRAKKACESHFGLGNCCVITGGYQNMQYGKCGDGGYGSSIHWHWDSHPSGHCGPNYTVGDVVSPGWCGSVLGNFMD